MIVIDRQFCTDYGLCAKDYSLGVIAVADKKAVMGEGCAHCRVYLRVCPAWAVRDEEALRLPPGEIVCAFCPVSCRVVPGRSGACRRFVNTDEALSRRMTSLAYAEVAAEVGPFPAPAIATSLITAIGVGGTYPDYVSAPYIVTARRDEVDMVTAVTETPLSYSEVKIKVDTDLHLGEEDTAVTPSRAAPWTWWKPRNRLQDPGRRRRQPPDQQARLHRGAGRGGNRQTPRPCGSRSRAEPAWSSWWASGRWSTARGPGTYAWAAARPRPQLLGPSGWYP